MSSLIGISSSLLQLQISLKEKNQSSFKTSWTKFKKKQRREILRMMYLRKQQFQELQETSLCRKSKNNYSESPLYPLITKLSLELNKQIKFKRLRMKMTTVHQEAVVLVIRKNRTKQKKRKQMRMEKSNRRLLNRESKELEGNKNTMAFQNLRESIKLNNKRERSVKTRFPKNKRRDLRKSIDQFITINKSSIVSIILAIVTKYDL